MQKKGAELAVSTIVMIVLGLAVLVILILVVRQQVTKGAGQYGEISESVGGAGGCFDILKGRSCVKGTACPPDMEPAKNADKVAQLTGWKDCEAKKDKPVKGTTYVCCQKPEA